MQEGIKVRAVKILEADVLHKVVGVYYFPHRPSAVPSEDTAVLALIFQHQCKDLPWKIVLIPLVLI